MTGATAVGVPDFAGRRVLVVGDVMLDRFVYGEVGRVSPEAPIAVFREGASATAMLGGAGNLARNVAALGGQAVLVGLVGDDAEADIVRRLAAGTDGLDARLVVDAGRPTTLKTRYVSRGQQLLRVDREVDDPGPHQAIEALIAAVRQALRDPEPPVHAVVLSDYAKGVLSGPVVREVVAAASRLHVPVLVDPKTADLSYYGPVDVLTPNAGELARATGLPVDSDESVETAALVALARARSGTLVVTRAERGLSVVPRVGAAIHWPARVHQVFDVSGAGDTVMAVLALSLASGLAIGPAAELANLAGGLVVQKAGTATISRTELADALADAHSADVGRKVVDLDTLAGRVAQWRDRGLRIGFTNGCFDLIHPGHAGLLSQARTACDRLVVGLNTDASVKRLKGPDRPVQSEQARATVLAALAAVDAVVLFDDDTPLALIDAIRPDVLVKGADYTVETVVGSDIVLGYGGRVLLADIRQGHSTSAIIARSNGGSAL
ncbi:MAG: D-glycero-beta-D-manno-heptose 1-phosphate adenylyltransferase [Alphaproteobacteria bacterium]